MSLREEFEAKTALGALLSRSHSLHADETSQFKLRRKVALEAAANAAVAFEEEAAHTAVQCSPAFQAARAASFPDFLVLQSLKLDSPHDQAADNNNSKPIITVGATPLCTAVVRTSSTSRSIRIDRFVEAFDAPGPRDDDVPMPLGDMEKTGTSYSSFRRRAVMQDLDERSVVSLLLFLSFSLSLSTSSFLFFSPLCALFFPFFSFVRSLALRALIHFIYYVGGNTHHAQ